MERIRAAVLLPVRIDVKDVYDETCTELRVTAALDSGGRGRPRVTYDVTAALANMGAPRISSQGTPLREAGKHMLHLRMVRMLSAECRA